MEEEEDGEEEEEEEEEEDGEELEEEEEDRGGGLRRNSAILEPRCSARFFAAHSFCEVGSLSTPTTKIGIEGYVVKV